MNKQQLANKIWESANKMRSKIEANEYKDYILGFIFYKFLSDKEVDFLKKMDMKKLTFRNMYMKTTRNLLIIVSSTWAISSPMIIFSRHGWIREIALPLTM